MAKRLRQANLFQTLAKKRATDEIEPSALLEELPVSGNFVMMNLMTLQLKKNW